MLGSAPGKAAILMLPAQLSWLMPKPVPGKAWLMRTQRYLDIALMGLDVAEHSVRHVGCTLSARA